ncbi:uncharacterized protein DUF3343 [Halanaerobium saccharolyticum]|uniref:Uncharacterized protein DUF3343 n=1 Tax=Halanaerobium saccharolyticum TaxID=43595 RepID=A0A4R7Z660_9FIRM|nr:DUF3343 domain-containing protein [Halanaerobium saccharolyticum]RAK08491.1 uncharacterized protein DUF3343 [Halanaerobium saccharolyticum]TDW03474.1 uncharacterized protein DUF3343 [Halanaerobium saccharolyticum]TDX59983.1 uncharacterized protein DUF3343 [Halanaerobium saccharolyticum]
MGVNNEQRDKLILFESTHHSIKAERVLFDNDLDYRMAAVPPEISSDCGSAITVPAELEMLKKLFEENNILVKAIYNFKKGNRKKEYKKIYSRD